MRRITRLKYSALAFTLTGMVAAPAFADKPAWAGSDKGDRGAQHERRDDRSQYGRDKHESSGRDERDAGRHKHFSDQHRTVIREYYVERYRSGRCPPGLAKKRNGCMPPGQARKWRIGHPLPREVIYHDLPPQVVTQIGPPPAGHRYVRVAGDILLIAIGTAMIVDAIEDLNR